jgi:hypothetical protein
MRRAETLQPGSELDNLHLLKRGLSSNASSRVLAEQFVFEILRKRDPRPI